MTSILQRHYNNVLAACQRAEPGSREDNASWAAGQCAALHVGIDAMARIQAKRLAPPPINPEWLGTERKPFIGSDGHALFRVLNRHVLAVMDAERRRTERLTATVRADAVGRHYAQAMLR